jgi:hypothetical protein
MADPAGNLTVSLGLPNRKDVQLPTGDTSPGISARPVGVALPGVATPDNTAALSLMRSLDIATDTAQSIGNDVLKEQREDEFKKGQAAMEANQVKFADAQAKGIIPQAANPWFIKGYQNQDGRVQGLDYYTQMRAAYDKSPAKGSDDPAAFQQFRTDFTKQYMNGLGTDKPGDWWDGFKVVSENADERLAHEHAQIATDAAVAKQATNTGSEINIILNSAKDPKLAADAINQLADKMKREGMTQEAFEKVAAEAVMAKAKLGDPKFLSTLDYIKAGGPDSAATLSSSPKVAMARADTEQWVIQKQRSAAEFAWAADNHAYAVNVTRPRAEEAYKHEQDSWTRQAATWTREDKARSLVTQIQTSILSDPESARANTGDLMKRLNDVDPVAARSTADFQEAYLTRSEHISADKEAPILAHLNEQMIQAAGNPAAQRQLMLDANQALSTRTLNRESVTNFLLDAQRFATFDPTITRKLQSPELNRVKEAAKGMLVDKINNPMGILFGPAQLDYLKLEQSINAAARKHLEAHPDATPDELSEVGTKALETGARALRIGSMWGDGGIGKIDTLGQQAVKSAQTLSALRPPDPTDPAAERPAPTVKPSVDPAEAVKHISLELKHAFLKEAAAAHNKGGTALLDYLKDFDAKMDIPGLGQTIIGEINSAREESERRAALKAAKEKK